LNILVIISQFHPAQTPNTLRWMPLIQEMLRRGHLVSVLTTKRRGRPDVEKVDGITIYRAGYNTLLDRLYDLTNRKSRRNETGSSVGSPGLLASILQRVADKTWRKRYWPDGSKLFLKPGIKQGETIIQEKNIDRVISVGLPFTAHLIGQAIKETNPTVWWQMDVQDPFCYSKEFWVNNYDRYADKNVEAEKKAFSICDKVTVTNAVAQARYAELFPLHTAKIEVTTPLFAFPDIVESDENKFYKMHLYARKTHLTYAGSFYNGVRSIEPFLKFLTYMLEQEPSLFNEIQFHFVGQMDAGTMKLIDAYPDVRRWFVLHGFKNRDQTMAALQQTDFVMNFGNSTDYHLPSKVVDYLYLNKPLVNFVSIDNDSTKAFLADKSLSVAHVPISKDLASAMQLFKSFLTTVSSEVELNPKAIAEYTPSALVETYLS